MPDAQEDKPWTILRVLQWTAERFAKANLQSPRLDAEVLLSHALSLDRIHLYMQYDKPLAQEELTRFRKLVRRRLAREPVAYLVGLREFWSLPLLVDRSVLIPRPETELLVEAAKVRAQHLTSPIIVDVGTGSGAIALALAKELPQAQIYALDLQPSTLVVAQKNATRLGVHLTFIESNLLQAFPAKVRPDLILSNPPYIPSDDISQLEPEVRDWEPRQALDGGSDGLDLIRLLIPQAARQLTPGGWLGLEIGWNQAQQVRLLLEAHGFSSIEVLQDLEGHERAILGRVS